MHQPHALLLLAALHCRDLLPVVCSSSPADMPYQTVFTMQVKPTPTLGREAAPAETPELVCAVSLGQPRPAGCRHRASWRHVELRGARLLPLPAHPGPALALPPQHHLQVQAAMKKTTTWDMLVLSLALSGSRGPSI